MSVIKKALNAIRETIKLADDVKRTAETVKDVAKELREHETHHKTRSAMGNRNGADTVDTADANGARTSCWGEAN